MEAVSPSIVAPGQTKSRRLAAKACWAACVRMASHRERRDASTALRRMSGAPLDLVGAGRRRKVWFPGSIVRTICWHRLERRSCGYARSLDLRALLAGASESTQQSF